TDLDGVGHREVLAHRDPDDLLDHLEGDGRAVDRQLELRGVLVGHAARNFSTHPNDHPSGPYSAWALDFRKNTAMGPAAGRSLDRGEGAPVVRSDVLAELDPGRVGPDPEDVDPHAMGVGRPDHVPVGGDARGAAPAITGPAVRPPVREEDDELVL